jgi:hypothetical protein
MMGTRFTFTLTVSDGGRHRSGEGGREGNVDRTSEHTGRRSTAIAHGGQRCRRPIHWHPFTGMGANSQGNDPPAEPEPFRLLAPQRGQIATEQ